MKKNKKLLLSLLMFGAFAGVRAENNDDFTKWTTTDWAAWAQTKKGIAQDKWHEMREVIDSDTLPQVKIAIIAVPTVIGYNIIPLMNMARCIPLAGGVVTTFGLAAGLLGGINGLRHYNNTDDAREAVQIGLADAVDSTGKGFNLLAALIRCNVKISHKQDAPETPAPRGGGDAAASDGDAS